MKTYFVILFYLMASTVYGQGFSNDSLVIEETCINASYDFQNKLVKKEISEIDSIIIFLNMWERACYYNEPIQRVYMLMDISLGNFNPNNYIDYYTSQYFEAVYRLTPREEDENKESYSRHESYFSYVRIGGSYDKWTMNIAQELLPKLVEGTDEYLICLLYSGKIDELNQALDSDLYNKTYLKRNLFNCGVLNQANYIVSIGGWAPVGLMSEDFSLSPQIAVGGTLKISSMWFIEGLFRVTILLNNEELQLREEDILSEDTPGVHFYFGAYVGQQKDINSMYMWEVKGGIGVSSLDTDVEKVYSDEEEDISISTFDISVASGVYKRMNGNNKIGLVASLHLSPFNISKSLESSIGNLYSTFGVSYKF